MSRYRGNADECPHCGMKYGRFTTGLRYYDVFLMLKDYSNDPSDWTYKRRGTVLGKWHQIKKQMWEYHVEYGCDRHPHNVAAATGTDDADQVPF